MIYMLFTLSRYLQILNGVTLFTMLDAIKFNLDHQIIHLDPFYLISKRSYFMFKSLLSYFYAHKIQV
jgi:hypothetical protein